MLLKLTYRYYCDTGSSQLLYDKVVSIGWLVGHLGAKLPLMHPCEENTKCRTA